MTDHLRILLATGNVGYEQRVRNAFEPSLNGALRRWDTTRFESNTPELTQQLEHDAPDVVAIGPDLPLGDALALARQLERERPEISVVLVSPPSDDLWREALRSGVRDVLAPDATDADVREVFERALAVSARRRQNLTDHDDAAGRTGGRIITVLSPKGGSGKTTVCSNLAVSLALAEPDRTVLVDLDLQFGDVSTALRLTPEHSIVDAVRAGAADQMALKTFLTPHATNLWSLAAPDSPADGEEITADQAQAVVTTLAQEFAHVIVDTAAGLSEHTLAMIDISTDLLLVCAMDVPSVRSLRKEVEALEQLGMVHQRRHFVINRADSKVGLDVADVEATVGLPVDVAIPSSRAVPLSMNQGTPVVESQPRSPVARGFTSLVGRFLEEPAESTGRRRRRSAR